MRVDYTEYQRKCLRRAVLAFLKGQTRRESSDDVLMGMLDDILLYPTPDQLAGEIAWLRENGLVETRELGNLTGVKVTPRGVLVADDKAGHPGVARPDE